MATDKTVTTLIRCKGNRDIPTGEYFVPVPSVNASDQTMLDDATSASFTVPADVPVPPNVEIPVIVKISFHSH